VIDIHCHILPKVDDGTSDMEDAIMMARQAVKDGIYHIVATPHHRAHHFYNERDTILEAVSQLSRQLEIHNIPLHIYPGQEVRTYSNLLLDYEKGLLQSLNNSRYLLIEFPSSHVPDLAEELLYELNLLGIVPIIAHPERNKELANDSSRLRALVRDGALAQMTTNSITGQLGKNIQKISLTMCKEGLVHFIATDAHNVQTRPCILSDAYQVIQEQLGREFVDYYQNNAKLLLHNETIEQEIPLIAKRRWYKFW